MPRILALAIWAACATALAQAPRIITTIAGTDYLFPDDGRPAAAASLGTVSGVVVDAGGHLVFTDTENGIVARVDAQGLVRVLGGNGIREITGDGGHARNAGIREAGAIALAPDGSLYFTDSETVRRIAPDGTISTIAGGGTSRAEGIAATSAELVTPSGVAVAANGELYISDVGRNRIFRVAAGILRTFAGASTPLREPRGIALDAAGNLYVSENLDNPDGGGRVRRIAPDGTIAPFAGDGLLTEDGIPALQFQLNRPQGLGVGADGSVYITDIGQEAVFRVSGGLARRFAGRETEGPLGDGGPARAARLTAPYAVAADRSGNVYIAEFDVRRVRRVDTAGTITTFAGSGVFRLSGDGGPASSATLNAPTRVVPDPAGNLYFNDFNNNRIRRISPSGIVATIAGGGVSAADSGPALDARLVAPFGLGRDSQGNIYIGDAGRIRRVTPAGAISTVAGGGDNRGENVPAREAQIDLPSDFAVDRDGNLYFAEYQAHRVRRLGTDGRVSTVAGNGEQGFSGDGGPAALARLNDPRGLALDAAGNLYIAEYNGLRVRRVTPARIITTFAGGGTELTDDGVATRAALGGPSGLAFDAAGNLYIADSGTSLIRRVTPAGAISRFAGNGQFDFGGDGGPATSAALGGPGGVAVDGAGNVLIADTGSHRIRSVLVGTPAFQANPLALTFTAQSGGAIPPEQTVELSSNVPLPFTVTVRTTTGGAWLEATPARGHLRAALRVTINPASLAAGEYEGFLTVAVPNATPSSATIRVAARIVPPETARPVVEPAQLDFELLAGDRPSVRHIRVSNAGGGNLAFAARTSASWLSVAPPEGTASAAAPATLNVTADPAGLTAGTYRGEVVVTMPTPASEIRVPVTLLVGRVPKSLLLSQTGVTFVAVRNGGAPPPHTVAVLNAGQGTLAFTASTSEFSGASGWLSVRPTAAETVAGSLQVPSLEISVNANALDPGDYFGQVLVAAQEADNSPQVISAVLSVLAAGSVPPPVIRPTGLVFIGEEGASPGSQDLAVSNLGANAASYISGRTPEPPEALFQALPAQGTVQPGAPLRIVVQPDFRRLTRGVRRGTLTLDFGDSFQTVRVLLVVVPRATGAAAAARSTHGNCVPASLQSEFTLVPKGFTAVTGLPLPIEARVVDDCGHRLTGGAVTASFSNGDPPVALAHLGDGRWSGTWIPKTSSLAPLLVKLTSISPDNALRGESVIDGSVRSGGDSPLVASGGVLNAGAAIRFAPVSPGALVEIYGAGLAESLVIGDSRPLATRLGSTEVIMQGRRLPLLFVSTGQVNAVVPYGVSVNTRLPLVVRRGSSATAIETIAIAPAQPSVFRGAVLGQDGAIVGPARPARRGEALVVFCAGLGAVDPPVADGVLSPSDTLSRVTGEVAATIGGRTATVLFAGLTPGFVGLYQVNLLVAADTPPSPAAPLVLIVSGQSSAHVEIPVE